MMPKAVWVYQHANSTGPEDKAIWVDRPKDLEGLLARRVKNALRRVGAHAAVLVLSKFVRMPWGTMIPTLRGAKLDVMACPHCRETAREWYTKYGLLVEGMTCPSVPDAKLRWAMSGDMWVLTPTWDDVDSEEVREKRERLWVALTMNGTEPVPTVEMIAEAAEWLQFAPGWPGSTLVARVVEWDVARRYWGKGWRGMAGLRNHVLFGIEEVISGLESVLGYDEDEDL